MGTTSTGGFGAYVRLFGCAAVSPKFCLENLNRQITGKGPYTSGDYIIRGGQTSCKGGRTLCKVVWTSCKGTLTSCKGGRT